jgi:hypothetical protein
MVSGGLNLWIAKLGPFKITTNHELPGLAEISALRGSIFVGRLIAELPI